MNNNKLIIAAAGAGKTTRIVRESAELTERVLVTTFTKSNEKNIQNKFYEINREIPVNVDIITWFSFLISHGIKPYQNRYFDKKIRGMQFVQSPSGIKKRYSFKDKETGKLIKRVLYHKENTLEYYFNENDQLYSDKLSKLCWTINKASGKAIISRLEEIYSHIYIDEAQDLAGFDLEIVKLLAASKIELTLLYDPRQVTYLTHHSKKHTQYRQGKLFEFVKDKCTTKKNSFDFDPNTLNHSYRCNQLICEFASTIYPEYPAFTSENKKTTGHDGVFEIDISELEGYLSKFSPVQLRYNRKTEVHSDYQVFNYGESKGLTFDRVVIYVNDKTRKWLIGKSTIAESSRAKFFVAVTRARYSVCLVHNEGFADLNTITAGAI